ncbi:hypothetical protein HK101_008193 [Irineochytrium annulatum]|nr:hypothetical protein HK101_008193 [Irineochytrium annulatum]
MDSPHDRENGDYPDPHPAHLAAPQGSQSMGRKKSLVRPERSRSHDPHPMSNLSLRRRVLAVHDSRHDSLRRSLSIKRDAEREGPKMTCWVILSRILTFFLPSFLLTRMGKRDANTQQAFREKIALCMIIFFLMCTVGFLTFGFTVVLCPNQRSTSSYGALGTFGGPVFAVHGRVYNLTMGGDGKPVNPHAKIAGMPKYASTNWPVADKALANLYMLDVSAMFPPVPGSSNCNVMPTFPVFPCTVSSPNGGTIWPVK